MNFRRKSKKPGSWTVTVERFVDYLAAMGSNGQLIVTDPDGRSKFYDEDTLRHAYERGRSAVAAYTGVPVRVMRF